jgi:hypothetical protein
MDRPRLSPVPGRECGECNACCQYLKIDTPELRKGPNIPCRHWNGGCTIYDRRPDACRRFFCGWRLMPNLDETWRPDRSNVMLRLVQGLNRAYAIDVNLTGPLTARMTEKLLRYIGALIEGKVEIYLVIPGPPGHAAAKVLLNNRLKQAIESRHYTRVRTAFEEAVRACRALETRPVVFSAPEIS